MLVSFLSDCLTIKRFFMIVKTFVLSLFSVFIYTRKEKEKEKIVTWDDHSYHAHYP
jgi:hypothetical protein